MRAGKLKMKRYPVRKRGGGWVLLLLLGVLLGAGAATFGKQAFSGLVFPQFSAVRQPSIPQTPEFASREERILTLPGHTWFALQLGVFDSEEAAESLAASYRSRGAGGYVRTQDQYRVLAAAYAARADAQAVLTQLRTLHQVDAVLTEIVQPEVTLRLTGRPEQLTALSDACDALEQLSIELAALSNDLDRGAADRQTTLDALRSHRETLTALKSRIDKQFGENAPDTVRKAAEMLDALSLSLGEALSVQGTAALGARVKYAQLQCLCRMADYAEALSRQGVGQSSGRSVN